MINPEDLMLGNFVSHNGVAGSGKIIAPIEAIYENVGRNIVVAGIRDSSANFEPIPLTEKILIDSGFKLLNENELWKQFILKKDLFTFYVFFNNKRNDFAIKGESAQIDIIRCHETKYVHNLQNACRIAAGQDLDLVINDYSTTI